MIESIKGDQKTFYRLGKELRFKNEKPAIIQIPSPNTKEKTCLMTSNRAHPSISEFVLNLMLDLEKRFKLCHIYVLSLIHI